MYAHTITPYFRRKHRSRVAPSAQVDAVHRFNLQPAYFVLKLCTNPAYPSMLFDQARLTLGQCQVHSGVGAKTVGLPYV